MSSATLPSSLLSPSQIAAYNEAGYCIVDGLYSAADIDAIEAFFEEYKKIGAAIFDADMKFEEIDPTKRQLRAMHPHRYSEQAKKWALNPGVMSVLATLFGKPALLAQTMYYFKPPGAKGQGMHQDNFYLLAKPATCIGAWTAIDDAKIENGCLYIVPGSHAKNILCPAEGAEGWMSYGDSHIKPFPRDCTPVPLEVKRGQTVFFSGNLIHGSGPNRTKDRSRRTFIGHYIDATSDQVAKFYHPVLNAKGETVSNLAVPTGGGPCGDGWVGAVH
ncbi:MAG TPA: phytanoyl-CoA dioxygenase family protein [Opitutaceae bacterium]|nr:phytanoyl-CoA dioxygenase family protein [Opitutaceae bacterium]